MIKKAILFCENNEGIVDLASYLDKSGWTIYSNGKTGEILKENGIAFKIEHAFDNTPRSIQDSAMLVQKVLRTRTGSMDTPFENPDEENNYFLVCVNFDPLESTFESIPKIGVGTPALTSFRGTMIRNCCTNYLNVLILTDPSDYKEAMIEIRTDNIQQTFRMYLAGKALNVVSAYDSANASAILFNNPFGLNSHLRYLTMPYKKLIELKQGKNVYQDAVVYQSGNDGGSLAGFKKLQGNELTHQILSDTSFGWDQVCSLYDNLKGSSSVKSETCDGYPYVTQFTPLTGTVYTVIVKYRLVVGASLDTNVLDSFKNSLSYDSDSNNHSIVACSAVIDKDAASEIIKYNFYAIVAPGFTEEAKTIFSERKEIRLISATRPSATTFDAHILDGGCIIQTYFKKLFDKWVIPTKERPNQKQCDQLAFGLSVAKSADSYATVCVKNNSIIGIASGYTSRFKSLGSVLFESKQTFKMNPTEDNIIADVLISDSNIELCDPVKELIDRGVKAILQTGGNEKDQELINYCDEHNVAMVFTGITHTTY